LIKRLGRTPGFAGGAALCHRRRVLRGLFDRDTAAGAHGFVGNHAVLFEPRRLCRYVAGGAAVLDAPTSPLIILLMIAIGALGGLGHYLLIIAHRLAPAPVLAPFVYTQLVWMITLGYVVFGDLPHIWTLAGAAIVIGSGLYLLRSKRPGKV
jgi:hypothetical protein